MSNSPALAKLLSPWKVHDLLLPNRVVMAPMTRGRSPDGVPTAEVADYYRRRAEGGVGLIITEGTGIERPASLHKSVYPRLYGEAALAGWQRVVDAVHAAGGRIASQLWHMGGGSDSVIPQGDIDMPSRTESPGYMVADPMSEEDIADTIAAYARAAVEARRLGFDAVELHGAHGYLIDQFFCALTNTRSDAWGGATLSARTRFAVEVVRAVRRAVGPDFPVMMRISQWKMADYAYRLAATPDELQAWVEPLADAGVDVFHASQRRFWEPEFSGSSLNLAGWVRKLAGKPTITVGSVGLSGEYTVRSTSQVAQVRELDDLLERLERDEFDLVAVGRALIQDPLWLTKIREGRMDELQPYRATSLQTLY